MTPTNAEELSEHPSTRQNFTLQETCHVFHASQLIGDLDFTIPWRMGEGTEHQKPSRGDLRLFLGKSPSTFLPSLEKAEPQDTDKSVCSVDGLITSWHMAS